MLFPIQLPNIKGLQYLPDFITTAEETQLISDIDQSQWLTDLKRRVQHYGYKYDYKARRIDHSMHLGDLPKWSDFIVQRLLEKKIITDIPDQLIINEYQPGQGIAAHIDCQPCFKDTILSLSLVGACIMQFSHKDDPKNAHDWWLQTRSLLVLSDLARYNWKHCIKARKTDLWNGQRHSRTRRISMTFRRVILV